ncbi:MAG: hypothetical protein JXE07_04060, partial [Candidatus Aminicenantes bacterium]|nr:hypothetical protein [Candidatus Aminicenantes bacterium]
MAEALVLGTYHMGNPGRDIFNMKAEHKLAPERQADPTLTLRTIEESASGTKRPFIGPPEWVHLLHHLPHLDGRIQRVPHLSSGLGFPGAKLTNRGCSATIFAPGGVAQLVRACGSYPQCRGFK